MRQFLVFRLFAPMASWGGIAVGEVRPSDLRPSRSALLGLFAAALGLRRDDEEAHRDLGAGLRFAVRVDSVGVPLVDYHTAQVARPDRRRPVLTRADELLGSNVGTILSSRHYRCDADYVVVAWSPIPEPRWTPRELAKALRRPRFVLYLGRKSCPLATPLKPDVVEATTVLGAIQAAELKDWPELPAMKSRRADLFWEGDEAIAGVEAQQVVERRDDPVSRERWTFRVRRELSAPVPMEDRSDVSEQDSASK